MADHGNVSSTATPPSSAGRGHARSRSGSHTNPDGRFGGNRGRGRGGRGRGRGQGRGPGDNAVRQNTAVNPEDNSGRPPGGFGARLTEAASQTQDGPKGQTQPQGQEGSVADDQDVCFICANPIEHIAIAPCNHQTCHICSLRLRALYKIRACAHCRTEAAFVIFTDQNDKKFQDFQDSDFVKIDDNLGVKYEKDVILEDTILLLRYNCPETTCDVACLGWPDLHRHVKSIHGKVMCDLCTRNKKVFTHEHDLFSLGELRRHEKSGDDKPGTEHQSGFLGHPECGFCKKRFYGDDELYKHCREKHERCHICDRRNANDGRSPQYYLNYEELEKHFADVHFVCLDAECQANKTNVFESEMDLKAHQIAEHPNGISKGREGRLINLSGFDLRTPYQPQRRGGRENRGSGRGRDPNAEPLPVSSAQPMSRAELAYQRQMALSNVQSGPGRTFGGSLTQPAPSSAPRPQPSPRPQAASLVPAVADLALNPPVTDPANLTPQEQARQLRHQAVSSRASSLLKADPTKLSQFRSHVSAYRSGTTSATDLIDAFFSLFDCPSSELGKLVRELADLYEEDTKRQGLLEAWNSWRSINEDYPSLPGPSGTLPGSSTNLNFGSGRRVLKLKSSTAPSARSSISRTGSWGNALTSGSRDPFPALSSTTKRSQASSAAPWGSTTQQNTSSTKITTSTSTQANPRISTTASRITNSAPPPTMTQRQNEQMFPSLPAAAKPNLMISGFNTRGSGKWGSGANTPNAWGHSASITPQSGPGGIGSVGLEGVNSALVDGGQDNDGSTAKKKGKKPKKQVLYQFG